MTYFICIRCGIEVKFNDEVYDLPEELLCEDCYLDTCEERR